MSKVLKTRDTLGLCLRYPVPVGSAVLLWHVSDGVWGELSSQLYGIHGYSMVHPILKI